MPRLPCNTLNLRNRCKYGINVILTTGLRKGGVWLKENDLDH